MNAGSLARCASFLLAGSLLGGCAARRPSPAGQGVQITRLPDRLRVELNGALFTEYFYTNVPKPYAYPLTGPGGALMTRNWPLKTVPGEQHDHPHHRSFWFGHGAVNGQDFWAEASGAGKIVHAGFLEVHSGKKSGAIRSKNDWVARDGTIVCSDERTLRFHAPRPDDSRIVDFEITLHASNGNVTFGDTKEGTLAVRLAETMRLHGANGHGHIVNSSGDQDGTTWGKRANWCDYYGPVQDKIMGIAIFDHPGNPRHPTWWHVRDYGLFAANPFGRHDFESLADTHAGDLVIPAGHSVTFRYRLFIHSGDTREARIEQVYQDYLAGR